MLYRIGSIVLDSAITPAPFESFICDAEKADVTLRLANADVTIESGSDVSTGNFAVRRTAQGWFLHPVNDDTCGLFSDRSYSDLQLLKGPGLSDDTANLLLRVALECRMARDGYISLHAACVRANEHTVAFTGHSTLGKSTRAAAAIEAYQGELLSGDRPLIDTAHKIVHGVPWDGKEACYRNAAYPLDAVFDIRRSPEPYVRELTAEQKQKLLMRQCFLALWDPDTAALQMMNIRRMIRNITILRLFCGPTAQDIIEAEKVLHAGNYLPPAVDLHTAMGLTLQKKGDMQLLMRKHAGKKGEAIALNEVGAFIWKNLVPGNAKEDIVRAVCNEFDVAKARAEADLDRFLETLKEMGALSES